MKQKLKICGMKFPDNIQEIISIQPDYLGFIFWEKSSRFMNLDIPEIPESIKKVGVFVNAEIEYVIEKINHYNLDFVQLHGQETVDYCQQLKNKNFKIIKAFSISDNFDFTQLFPFCNVVDYFLFDTQGKLPGGNGTTFNWEILQNYTHNTPYFLSGGIGLNESAALKSFLKSEAAKNCWAIDVNSKFELQPGLKNIIELQNFKNIINEIHN